MLQATDFTKLECVVVVGGAPGAGGQARFEWVVVGGGGDLWWVEVVLVVKAVGFVVGVWGGCWVYKEDYRWGLLPASVFWTCPSGSVLVDGLKKLFAFTSLPLGNFEIWAS